MFNNYKHIIPDIFVGSGVVDTVADWFCADGRRDKYKNVLLVCDPNTRRVAGERVLSALKAIEGINITEFCFTEDEPLPNEYSIGCVLSAFTPDVDIILAVGSGTINDICTYIGVRVNRPSIIVGTAPSMDGYASLGSAMLLGGVKVTPSTQCPIAIFCDTDILSQAPMHMIAAGLGDMLGKLTSLADWKLSHLLTGEPIPNDIFDLMQGALDKIIKAAPLVAKRDKAAIESITEGLILSGIAMSLYGDSRPASGTEHHLAHFWEMRMLACGQKPELHGTKVAVAAIVGLVMWEKLSKDLQSSCRDERPARPCVDNTHRISEIRRLYGATAETLLQTENPNLSLEHIEAHRPQIMEIARSLPSPQEIARLMSLVEMNACPKTISLSAEMLKDSIIYARERKKTYTLLQLLGDLGRLEDYADAVQDYFESNALANVKCFVLDMDGTIYLGNRLFSYTPDFLKHLDQRGLDYVFFTNNSSQNAAHYIKKLHSMGIDIPDDKLLMSTHVLLDYLNVIYRADTRSAPTGELEDIQSLSRDERLLRPTLSVCEHPQADASNTPTPVFIAGTKALMDDFTAAGYTLTTEKPEFCVLGFDTYMDYGRLTKLCDFVRAGVPVYGVNMDYNCPIDGGFIPDCGSLGAAVTASTGVDIEFFGKPSRRALEYIAQKTGYKVSELCFVGDRLYTDIAITAGSEACSVLVLSGETKQEDLQGSKFVPDLVVNDLRDLVKLIVNR